MRITREEAISMSEAHADGLHDEWPREGCPDCEGRPIKSYPQYKNLADPTTTIVTDGSPEAEASLMRARLEVVKITNKSGGKTHGC